MPAEIMTQSQIDSLLVSMGAETGTGKGQKLVEVKYHFMICLNCKKLIASEDIDLHYYLASSKCPKSTCGHAFASEEWVRDKKSNPSGIGWRRTDKIVPAPRSRMVLKVTK